MLPDDDTPGAGAFIWTGTFSNLFLSNVKKFTITAAVVDNLGRLGLNRVTCNEMA